MCNSILVPATFGGRLNEVGRLVMTKVMVLFCTANGWGFLSRFIKLKRENEKVLKKEDVLEIVILESLFELNRLF